MKKLMFALTMMLGTAVAVQAQETQDTTSTDQSSQYRTDDQSIQDQPVTEDPTLQDQPTQDQPTQDESYRTDDMSQEDQDKGQEISVAELPAAVSTQLQSSDYTGWTVTKAHKKMKDGQTVYAVEMSQGSETKKVKFDEQGNVLKEKDKKDRDQK